MVDGRGQRTTPARNNRTVDSASDDDEHAPDSQQAHDANVKNVTNLQDSFRSWRKWIGTYPIVLQNLQLCGHFSAPGICYCNQSFFQPKLAWTTARSVSNLMMSTNNMLRTSTVQRKESKNVEDCSRQPRGGKDEIQRRVSCYTYDQRGEGVPEFR